MQVKFKWAKRLSKRQNRQAVSLVELLVSSAVLALVVTMAYELLITGTRYLRESNARIDTQRDGLMILVTINRELREASYRSIGATPEGGSEAGLVFASPRRDTGLVYFDGAGNPGWARWICYARKDLNLYRWEENLAAPPKDPPIPSASGRSVAYFSNILSKRKLISDGVSSFSITPNATTKTVRVLTQTSRLGGSVQLELQTTVIPSP